MKIKEKVLTIFSRCNRWFDDAYAETMRFTISLAHFKMKRLKTNATNALKKEETKKKKNKTTNNQ